MGRTRWFWSTLFLLVSSLLAAAAPGLAEAPRLVRADEPYPLHGGTVLVHAGGERPTTLRVYMVGPEGARPTDQVLRSGPEWALYAYTLGAGAERAEVRAEGPVWVATGVPRVADEGEVVLECDALGSFLFWDVDVEEVRVLRDDVQAPQVRPFTPRAEGLVPDEAAVRDHTILMGPDRMPLYLEVARGGAGCAGTATLIGGEEPGASPFAGMGRGSVLTALVVGAVLATCFAAIGVRAWWRDRQRRTVMPASVAALLYRPPLRGSHMVWRMVALAGLVVLFASPVGASTWGLHEVGSGQEVALPGGGDHWVCVAAPGSDGAVVLHQDADAGAPEARVFEPSAERADCRLLPEGTLTVDASVEGTVRVLVLTKEPRAASTPGVVRLTTQGVAFAIPQVSADTEIGVLPDGAGVVAEVFRADDLDRIATARPPGDERFVLGAERAPGAGILVVLVAAPDDGSAIVDWEDPNWYRPAPTIGHIAVVVALALFVVLYHGRSPRRLG